MRNLITLRGLGRTQIEELLDHAQAMADGRSNEDGLKGATVANVFYEASTRTRLSFELAARRLGAHVLSFSPDWSSAEKGETFEDTILTLTAMRTDVFVVRHHLADAPDLAAAWSGRAVINAGAGKREHPTQTLADALTLRQRFGQLDGLKVAIVGDVRNSRVARGHLAAFPTLGIELSLIAPTPLLPPANPWGVRTVTDLDEELGDLDVVYVLRIQKERGSASGIPSETGYARRFGMNQERLSMLKPTAVIMHPGPVNRGIEIDDAAVTDERSLILQQVSNGVPVRMAVLAGVVDR